MRGGARPVRRRRAELRQRRRRVHRRDLAVEQQLVRDLGEAAVCQRLRERAVLLQHVGGLLRPDAGRARDLVRRVTAQRDEVRHLRRLDAVALAHLGRADPRQLGDALDRLQDHHPVGDELERIAVGGRHEHRAGPRLRRGSEEVVGLVARRLRRLEPERLDERRQEVELLEDRVLEDAARLVGGQRLVPVGGRVERVPADEHRLRLLGLPQPLQEPREADERVEANRLRQRVVGAVRERVAVDREQETAHSDSSSSWIAAISRSVAVRAASAMLLPVQILEVDRLAVPHAPLLEPAQAVGALDPRRDERHAGLERDPRGAGVRAGCRASSSGPSGAACPRGTSRSRCPREPGGRRSRSPRSRPDRGSP